MRFLSFRRGLLSLRLFDRSLGFFRRGPIRRAAASFAGLGISRQSRGAAASAQGGHGDASAAAVPASGSRTRRTHAATAPSHATTAQARSGRAAASRGERRGWSGSKSLTRRRRHTSTVSLRGGEALEGRRVLATAATGIPFATTGVLGGGGLNRAEELAGFTIRVPLGSSGAVAGDNLTLLNGGASIGTIGLAAADITAGFRDFPIASGVLGADGTKNITASITGGGGPFVSTALTFLMDTVVPSVPSVTAQTTNSLTPTITGTTGSGSALADGTGAASSETMNINVTGGGTNQPFVRTNANTAAGNWTVTLAALPAGTNATLNVTVTVTDAVGNTATDATTGEVVIDTTAPNGTNTFGFPNLANTYVPNSVLDFTIGVDALNTAGYVGSNAGLQFNLNGGLRTAPLQPGLSTATSLLFRYVVNDTIAVVNGNLNATTAVTNINTTNLQVGMLVTGAGIPLGTTIAAIPTPGANGDITLSIAANNTANGVPLTFGDANVNFLDAFTLVPGTLADVAGNGLTGVNLGLPNNPNQLNLQIVTTPNANTNISAVASGPIAVPIPLVTIAFPGGGAVTGGGPGRLGVDDFILTRDGAVIALTGATLNFNIADPSPNVFTLVNLAGLTDTPGNYVLTFTDIGVGPTAQVTWVKSIPTAQELTAVVTPRLANGTAALNAQQQTISPQLPVEFVDIDFVAADGTTPVEVTGVVVGVSGAAIAQFILTRDGTQQPFPGTAFVSQLSTSRYRISGLSGTTVQSGVWQVRVGPGSAPTIRTPASPTTPATPGSPLLLEYGTSWRKVALTDSAVNFTTTPNGPAVPTTYRRGDRLRFQAVFTEGGAPRVVTVTGTPSIGLTIGGQPRPAQLISGNGTSTLTFEYEIGSNGNIDIDLDGIGVASQFTGTITDANDLPVVPQFAVGTLTPGNIRVDGVAPTVTTVTPPAPGNYNDTAGTNTLDITLNLSEAVNIVTAGGTPTIALTIGGAVRQATLIGGGGAVTFQAATNTVTLNNHGFANGTIVSFPVVATTTGITINNNYYVVGAAANTFQLANTAGGAAIDLTGADGTGTVVPTTNTLVFRYTITSATDVFANGSFAIGQVSLNGGTVRDAAGNDANLAFTAPPVAGVNINRTAPTVTVTGGLATTSRIGQVIELTATFAQAVNVTGTPTIGLTVGGTPQIARYVSGTGTNVLRFQYVVQAGDLDTDGIAIPAAVISLAGPPAATIADSVGTPVLTFAPPALATVLVDGVVPAILASGISPPPVGTYTTGNVLTFTVPFSDALTVAGTPSLSVRVGSTIRQATFNAAASALPSGVMVFTYTVTAADAALGISIDANAINLNGGTISDGNGNNAVLSHSAVNASTVAVNRAALLNVTVASGDNKFYRSGETIRLNATFSAPVAVTGTPTMTLSFDGFSRQATYLTGTGTTTLEFVYTVVNGDEDLDGIAFLATSISLTGGATITSLGANTTLAFSPPTVSGVRVDAVTPLFFGVSNPAARTYVTGEVIEFVADFSESMRVTPSGTGAVPRIPLVVGSTQRFASYVAGSETQTLIFGYTVQAGDLDTDGILASTSLQLNGGFITDLAGNPSTLTFTPLTTTGVRVDGLVPTVTRFSTTQPNGRYSVGTAIPIVATMSEAVQAGSGIDVILSTGAAVSLVASTAGNTLQGTYVVGAGENTSDLTVVLFSDNGVLDASGNALASVSLPTGSNNIGGARDIVIDTVGPTVVSFSSTTPDGIYGVGTPAGGIAIVATLNEAVPAGSSFNVTLNSTGVVTLSTSTQGTTLTGTYLIAPGENSFDLTVSSYTAGNVVDLVGNPLVVSAPPGIGNIGVFKSIVVDTAAQTLAIAPVELGTTRLADGFVGAGDAAAGNLTVRVFLGLSGAADGDRLELLLGGASFLPTPKAVTLSAQNIADGFVNFVVSPADLGADGPKQIAARVTDRAGNQGPLSPSLAFGLDRVAPTAPALGLVVGATSPVSRAEALAGAIGVTADPGAVVNLTFTRGTTSVPKVVALPAGTTSVAVPLTNPEIDALGDGTILVAASQTDAAGNVQTAAPAATSFDLDATAPSISVSTSATSLRIGQVATITFTVASPFTNFSQAAVTVGGGTLVGFTGSGNAFTATFVPATNSMVPGTVSVAAGAFTDVAGNPNTAGALPVAIAIDTVAPTVAITSSAATLRAGQTAVISFALSESVADFGADDVVATGGTLSGFAGSGAAYTALFTPLPNSTASGNVVVAGGRFMNAAGNGNLPASLATPIVIDTVPPTVAISSSTGALLAGQTATISFTLSEVATNFVLANVLVTGGTLSSFSGSGSSYTATFTPTAGSTGSGTITVPAGAFTDALGNPSVAATLAVPLAIDTVSPSLAITSSAAALRAGQTATIAFTVSEPVTTFSLNDVSVSGGTLSNFAGAGAAYTATFTPAPGSTAAGSVAVASGTFSDPLGNTNAAAALASSIAIDTILPTVTIASSATTLRVGETATIAFTLSEPSTTFGIGDITVTNGTLSNFSGSGTSYSALFTPAVNVTGQGTVAVAADAFVDSAGNGNAAAALALPIAVETSAPVVTGFSTSSPDREYAIGEAITIVANLSEPVAPGGTLRVVLNTGAVVTLTATGGAAASGTYTIQAGDSADLLNVASIVPTGTLRDATGNALTSTVLPSPANNLAGRHGIVVAGEVRALPIAGLGTDPTNVPAPRGSIVRLPIVFSTEVTGVTLGSFRLFLNGRSVSLRGARLTGSGATYELVLPARRTDPRGTYTLEVRDDVGIRAVSNGVEMAEPTKFFWSRGQSTGAARTARLQAFAKFR